MTKKPTEILELEKIYDITLEEVEFNEEDFWKKRNSYSLDEATNIVALNLSYNQRSNLESLEGLKSLQSLDLSGNQISNLESLEGLKSLQSLYLSGNQISNLESLEGLKSLQSLYLIGNQISNLESLEGLKSLQSLYLSGNKIEHIEELKVITKLEKIDYLSINNNPFVEGSDLKLKNVENHLQLILSKLKELEENITKITLPAKVMLLGNHAAGKSTFLEYLQSGNIKNISKSTPILKIEDYPRETEKDKLPQAIIYDFGGQDYYHGLYQAFFSLDTVNLLLWNAATDNNDIRKDSNNIYTRDFKKGYWLAQLHYAFKKERKYHTGASEEPTFLIQTHADKDNKITWENKKEIQQVTNEFYVSLHKDVALKTKVNTASLNYLKESVIDAIEQKQKPEDKPVWYKTFLTYILDNKPHTSTPLDVIINQYKRTKLSKDQKLSFLREDLQQLALKGMILYYKEDKELKDVAWLNPSETVEHIHNTILSHELITENKGILTIEEWETICDLKNIERLLIKEKVVFYDKHDKQYIIPNYLALSKEDKRYELLKFGFLKPNFTLKFKYFIPFGIINQLTCKFGDNPYHKAFWRDQLIFTYNDAKVFIKLDFNTLQISVFIQQNKPAALEEELFGIILKLYNNEDEVIEIEYSPKEEATIDRPGDYDYMESKRDYHDDGLGAKVFKEKVSSKKIILENNDYNSPDDMYLSVDENYFVHHKTLETLEDSKTSVITYPLVDGEIDESKPKAQHVTLYKNFTNNTNIKQMKKIFISYSKDDLKHVNTFINHLSALQRDGKVSHWYCSALEAGTEWDTEIQEHFDSADIVCFIVSPNFMKTDYILDYEVAKAFERKKTDSNFKIIPIILNYCKWTTEENNLGDFTALPYTAKPVLDFKNQDMAWYIIQECIRIVIDKDLEPRGDEFYASAKLPKDVLKIFERIVDGTVDDNSI
ncbi:leucine-rich repeat protein [Pontimicrobium sp. MEBiC06410]